MQEQYNNQINEEIPKNENIIQDIIMICVIKI